MPLPRIYLIDRREDMVNAWTEVFPSEEYPNIRIIHGDYLSIKTDAIVSPANSFGNMDGGLDALIADHIGYKTVKNLQNLIIEKYFGELPVGEALILETDQGNYHELISAPTMRIPENVSQTLNAYLAMRAILRVVKFSGIETVTVPGLCTGIGGMSPRKAAIQMKCAYDVMLKPTRIPSYDLIHKLHRAMQIA